MIYDKKRICSAPRIKTQKERELLQAKKKIKALPDNFFENILELDLKLKLSFSGQILEQLINLLKVAIEYYEQIGDPKYKDYQFMMEDLLTQPSVLKHLNKEGQQPEKPKKSGGILKKQKIEKNIQSNYMKNILMFSDENNIKVKEIIKDSIKQIPDTDLIFNDLQKQEDEFQKKLQERRRVNSWNKKHQNPDHFSQDQSSQEIALKSNNLSSGNLAGSENTSANNVNVYGNEDFFVNKMDENLSPRGFDNKDEKQTPTQQESKNEDQTLTPIKDDNISDIKDTVSTDMILTRNQTEQPKKFKQHRKHQSMFVLPDKVHEELVPRFQENQDVVKGIKEKIDYFLSEFNNYFHSEIFQKYTEHIERLMDLKYKKYLDISNKYVSQIKEMELLLTSVESGDQHAESIKDIINDLKRDQQKEINDNEDNHQKLMKESLSKFHQMGFKNNRKIDTIEKSFKVQVFLFVDSILKAG